ncbi:hypothetical protein LSUE1_G005989 [Lachnellula suecica]|uniref:Uncharacterized protein n=1 Tax=Lachnellula suecica TaxID=602035 RepID=A0A8T9C5J1_9HELO|nr:hypothetical protein LSUE1_G005989 [Lachnellula suecica]
MPSNPSKRSYTSFAEANGGGSSLSIASLSSKKARADPSKALWDQICKLPPQTAQRVLYEMCIQNPTASAIVHSAHTSRLAEEANKPPVNFDFYSKECWHTLNTKYKRLCSSKQFDVMGDIYSQLSESREAIMEQAGPDAKWQTRRNALVLISQAITSVSGREVLRKICKSIVLCNEQQIRHGILKDGYIMMQFTDSMLELATGMTEYERTTYKEEGLYEKLMDLQGDCDDWETDLEGLREIYDLFDGAEEGDEEEDSSSDSSLSVVEISSIRALDPDPPQRNRVFSVIELS